MSRAFEELDYRQTPMGELILRRRLVPSLDNREVHEVILGDAFLMSSLFTEVEVALARLGLAELEGRRPLSVVVGGLGLGYTARAALEHDAVESLIVVETMEAVIDWHQRGLVPLGAELTADPRCRFVHGDFFALAADPGQGFDPQNTGRRFDAVLLDIDHTPGDLLDASHAGFYQAGGLRRMAEHLTPGGVFGLWADGLPDPAFLKTLEEVFPRARAELVTFPNPLLDRDSAGTVYVARLAEA